MKCTFEMWIYVFYTLMALVTIVWVGILLLIVEIDKTVMFLITITKNAKN